MERLRRTLTAFVLALALLPMTAAAAPAPGSDTPDANVKQLQVLELLNSGNFDKQAKAVGLISHYAHTDQFDADFYRPLITPLEYIVAKGETVELQIMAVSALYSIGSEDAIDALRAQVDGLESNQVAEVAENAIAEYKVNRFAVRR